VRVSHPRTVSPIRAVTSSLLLKKHFWLVLSLWLGLSGPVFSQVRFSGYFSQDYLKGQAESDAPQGSFENPRAGLIFAGDWTPQFSCALELQAKDFNRFEMEQAWAFLRFSEALRLKFGLYLVPFGKYNESGRAFETRLVERPLPVRANYPSSWRDIGALIEGKISFVFYSAYIGNGLAEAESLSAGQQFRDNNRNKGVGGRLGLLLGQGLEAGVSYYSGRADTANSRSLSLRGFDVTWASQNTRLSAEYSRADIRNPSPYSNGTAEGFFVVLSFDIAGLNPLVAYEKNRTEDPFHGPGFSAGPGPLPGAGLSDDRSLWAVGLVYAVSPNILIKMEYDFNRETPGLRNDIFRAQAAVHF